MSHEIGWFTAGPTARAGAFAASVGIKPIAEPIRRNTARIESKMIGHIKHCNPRGFSFITIEGTDDDIFLHARNYPEGLDHLIEGTKVSFEVRPGGKPGKNEAFNVTLV